MAVSESSSFAAKLESYVAPCYQADRRDTHYSAAPLAVVLRWFADLFRAA